MKIKLIFALLLVMSFFLIFAPKVSYAADYMVKPFILIPIDWKDRITSGETEEYKKGILSNLSSVQEFYRSQFNGSTFDFDQSVAVVYSKNVLKGNEKEMLSKQFHVLNSPAVIKMEKGRVNAIWIVGSQVVGGVYAYSNGPELNAEAGKAVMPYEDLIVASGQGTQNQRQFAKNALAHELGHAFGAIWSDFANGHPCTEISQDGCKGKLEKYPPALEWTSIMGYGALLNQFSDLFFNNTIINPEMQVICKNPFIKCPSIPQPIESKTSDQIAITGFEPNTIIAGQTFEIRGSGFDQITRFRLEKMPERKEIVSTDDKLKIIEKSDGRVILQTTEDLVAPDTTSEWVLFAKTPGTNFSQFSSTTTFITIKGKPINQIILDGQIRVTCGQERRPVPGNKIVLADVATMQSKLIGETNEEGFVNLVKLVEKPVANSEYVLTVINSLSTPQGLVFAKLEDGSERLKVLIPDPPSDVTFTANFNYPACPADVSATPSPASSPSPIPSSTPEVSDNQGSTGQSRVSKLQISNYPDFEEYNATGDFGSPTEIIDNPAGYKVIWTLSTLTSDKEKEVYVRIFEGDNFTLYSVSMTDGKTTQVPFSNPQIEITAQAVNKLIRTTAVINGVDTDVDIDNGLQAHLNGQVGQAQDFDIPYEVEDAKGGIKWGAFKVVYRPIGSVSPSPSPSAATAKTVRGFYCSGYQIMKQYSDYSSDFDCNCGSNNGDCAGGIDATVCLNISKNDLSEEAKAIGLEFDAKCIEPEPSPTSSGAKTLTGWRCVDSSRMFRQYSDGSREFDCICGDGSEDCGNTPNSICRNKDHADYDVDAECVAPQTVSSPTPVPAPPGKTIRGWYCSGNQMMVRYTDYSVDYNCTCGDGSVDCSSYPNTVCRNKPKDRVPEGYESDAECIEPE